MYATPYLFWFFVSFEYDLLSIRQSILYTNMSKVCVLAWLVVSNSDLKNRSNDFLKMLEIADFWVESKF